MVIDIIRNDNDLEPQSMEDANIEKIGQNGKNIS